MAICVQRSAELIIGLLAILKAGAAYVPLDPTYPAERLAYLLHDSAPRAVLVHAPTRSALGAAALPLIDIDNAAVGELPCTNPQVPGLTAAHLAYVIYTSGSSGQPKGVMVEHRQLAQLVAWHTAAFGVGEGTRSSSLAGLSFDAAAWEIWPSLCSGGVLVMPSAAHSADVASLLQWWRAQELDVSFLPTPIAEHAVAAGMTPQRLRCLLVGGDRLRQVPEGLPFSVYNNTVRPRRRWWPAAAWCPLACLTRPSVDRCRTCARMCSMPRGSLRRWVWWASCIWAVQGWPAGIWGVRH